MLIGIMLLLLLLLLVLGLVVHVRSRRRNRNTAAPKLACRPFTTLSVFKLRRGHWSSSCSGALQLDVSRQLGLDGTFKIGIPLRTVGGSPKRHLPRGRRGCGCLLQWLLLLLLLLSESVTQPTHKCGPLLRLHRCRWWWHHGGVRWGAGPLTRRRGDEPGPLPECLHFLPQPPSRLRPLTYHTGRG